MQDLIRDSPLGWAIRFLTGNRVLLFPEEKEDFVLPAAFRRVPTTSQPNTSTSNSFSLEPLTPTFPHRQASAIHAEQDAPADKEGQRQMGVPDNADHEIQPSVAKDGKVIVTWYSADDPENPHNWSRKKKLWIAAIINAYSFAVYFGSSVYSPGVPEMAAQFGVSHLVGSLGLALYVLAYGIGPMVFSPLSEIPLIGRNLTYAPTFVIYVLLCIPQSLTNNFPGLLVIRFLLGFFGSPCLATGAATFSDMYDLSYMTYCLACWAGAVTLGPALAPVVAGFSVSHTNWHWFGWEMMWLSAPICIVMCISMPETSADNILLRRARRLRKVTGRDDLFSQSEINQAHMTAHEITINALIKPWEINILDPAVLFTTVYVALIYGIFYSFLECFPLVYPVLYNFNLGESTLPFLTVVVALLFAMTSYMGHFRIFVGPRVATNGWDAPENRLYIALYISWMIPIGLFIFAWTTRTDIHWIVSCIGLTLTMWGEYTVMQCVFMYLPFTYPKYAASLFAANDFARSAFAAGCILFSQPMFRNLGVPRGVSLLAGLTVACTGGLYILYYQGAKLRARSRFAQK
ncbi:major facilitator superfamily domain-containing protein [Stachybotrys elegans]|uniref:Major facilitator superfamily domain-containing protein n=1 Tax=Stachybotrys elegans TaxID=80388 RepID=A0A8K0WP86_9HYPO|nr:major facilitator superfamily domain-containing protein [Stachybotrys elegans]